MTFTRKIECEIESANHVVELEAKYCSTTDYIWISAIVDTGLELCRHDGYLKDSIRRPNPRLSSEKSIRIEAEIILDSLEKNVQDLAPKLILTEQTLEFRIQGGHAVGPFSELFFPAANIKALQSKQCLSWYEHDVFKTGTLQVYCIRNTEGRLEFFADEANLYDKEKLQALYDSKAQQEKRLAFFFYDELKRLLGMPYERVENMSGLFAQGGAK